MQGTLKTNHCQGNFLEGQDALTELHARLQTVVTRLAPALRPHPFCNNETSKLEVTALSPTFDRHKRSERS